MIRLLLSVLFCLGFSPLASRGDEIVFGPPEPAFDRIVPGWTNYSTAFNATHDSGTLGDFATVAASFAPGAVVRPVEFGVVVIGGGTRAPDFSRFQFRVMAWSSLEAFIRDSRAGDLANWNFAAPTAGSTTVPDTQTRGGRPAFLLRFALTNITARLEPDRTNWIGFAAVGDTQRNGELFVPTAGTMGDSDVQGGDIIDGGWRQLVDAGGSTIYSGQLAMALTVAPELTLPRLEIAREGIFLRISWPLSAGDFILESAFDPLPDALWRPRDEDPFEENGRWQVRVPAFVSRQWFRLRR